MIALPLCSSAAFYKDTTKNNPAKLDCTPDSVLRKATRMIFQGQDFLTELNLTKKNVRLLNQMLFYKDSIIFEDSLIIFDERSIINAKSGELDIEKGKEKQLLDKYRVIKVNDRLKMGIFTTIIVGLVYVYIEKK